MNIETVFLLSRQLDDLGFGDLSGRLVKQICFQPERFSIFYTATFGQTEVHFQILIGRDANAHYTPLYYDAALVLPAPFPQASMTGVDPEELDARMAGVDWTKAFDFSTAAGLDPANEKTWATEVKIETIVADLRLLDGTPEGKPVAAQLRERYWRPAGSADPGRAGGAKPEVTQRFYFVEGHLGITAAEACRFLQNRKVQKQLNGHGQKGPGTGTKPSPENADRGRSRNKERSSTRAKAGKK